MKLIVIGDGKVGRAIVEHASKEGHEIVVIDIDSESIEQIVEKYDVMAICGNGASYDIQKSAGVDKNSLVIAATDSDETNILSCLIAKKLGAKSTIARVRSYEYMNQINIIKNDLGITMTINPEQEAANEITKIINFPEALQIDSFATGKLDIVELYVPENNELVGLQLSQLHKKYSARVLVCAVQRDDEVIIPSGNFIFQAKDKIHITAKKSEIKAFITKANLAEDKIKDVMIIGGGKIAVYLGKELLKNKYNVKIIENDYERCGELSEVLPKASIIYGDGSDQNVLLEEGIAQSDAVICTTGIDEENIIVSIYAYKLGIQKIVTKISKTSLVGLMESISLASVISPQEITATKIISYLRALNNSRGSNIVTLHKLINNKVEALEFIAKNDKDIIGIPLKDLSIKSNTMIAAIIRNNNVIYPSGTDTIEVNDSVIIVTTNQFLDDLTDILE